MSTIIKHKQFNNFKSWTMDLCGRPLTIEVGKVAELASASAMVKYGDTTVMVAVTVSPRPRDGIDFFPLSVEFEEKLYAVGRIPGSFMRREGRPSLPAVLASRLIDRPMRPLFPYDFRNDVCIQCTVMSVDYDCSPEVAAMIGASACVSYSEIPFAGPIGCLEVGYCDGEIVLNPNQEQRKTSRMDVTVAATAEKVVMIEAGADEIPDEIMYAGIVKAHEEIKKQVAFINQIVAEIGKPKMEYDHAQFNQELFDKIVADFMDEAKAAMDTDDKNVRETRWNAMIDHWHEKYLEEYPDMDQYLEEFTYKFQKKIVKAWLLEGHRVDGRAKNEIRPLAAEVGVLPRVHGSGLFTRGQTQVLSVCTLNTLAACQKLDTIWEEEEKRYMHHYNFPPYSVGEARAPRSTNRRLPARSWIPSGKRKRSGICTTTTSPPTPWARPALPAPPTAGSTATALWPSVPWFPCCPLWTSSPMPSAWFLRCCPPTVLPLRAPSAAPLWPSWMPVCPSRPLWPASPAA